MPQLPFTFSDAHRIAKESAEETARAAEREQKTAPPQREPQPRKPAPAPREQTPKPVVFTVSQLQARLRGEIEESFGLVFVSGEISNYRLNARSGHAYFTLKDEGAQLKCVLFRDNAMRIRVRLGDGMQVIARGKLTVYEQGGDLQLNVQHVELRGVGARQQEYQERVEKLRKEGLTADARKRRLPLFPRTIGVVTSKSGAAMRDVLRTVLRRDPFAQVIISHTSVQGDGAGANIAQALRALDALGRCEVIIVCRGGGSIEDLWGFNEESVARAIVGCRVPVVTGIGHETDTTIADLVADLRASTPTAAAEHVVPVRSEMRQKWLHLENALHRALLGRTQMLGRRLMIVSARLKHPEAMLERRGQRIDELETRASRSLAKIAAKNRERIVRAERRLARLDPKAKLANMRHRVELCEAKLERARQKPLEQRRRKLEDLEARMRRAIAPKLDDPRRRLPELEARLARAIAPVVDEQARHLALFESRLEPAMQRRIDELRHSLAVSASRLDTLSPLKILARGYALVTTPDGHVVTSAHDVAPGDHLDIRLAEGSLGVEVRDRK